MDEEEFRRLLDLFPVVRPRDYHIDLDPSRQSTTRPTQDDDVKKWQDAWEEQEGDQKETSNQTIDLHDAFWEKLKLAAEKKVYEELSLDAARSIINSTRSSGEQLSS
ncbi:uncharacterized protein LOC110653347 isoform X2 [Hevea brasiliensis]|uniref:uncharacterized protein LOC110653347 isoform X2 n=1 Tax=Hevea brasiliensis TaxID=3981 RepID=UPI0025F0FEDF|nr:uncharacterized protein LOC110653347 isoform X2 [Hevea brasiliensis]